MEYVNISEAVVSSAEMSNNFINFVPSVTDSDSDPTCLPTSFGPRSKKKRSTVLIDSAQTIKIRDNEARERIREQPPRPPTARPFVPLKTINENLEIGGDVRLQFKNSDVVDQADDFVGQVAGVVEKDYVSFEVRQDEENSTGLALRVDGEQPVLLDI